VSATLQCALTSAHPIRQRSAPARRGGPPATFLWTTNTTNSLYVSRLSLGYPIPTCCAQNIHGPEGTADIAAAQQAAIERIATIVEKHKIDCDFVRVPGYMFHGLRAGEKGFQLDTLQSIWKAASDTGKLDMTLVDDAAIPGFPSGRAIRFDRQATFHPTKYVRALAKVITEELGGTIHEKTRMADYEETKSAIRGVTVNMTNGKKIVADQLVMATNVPLQKVGSISLEHTCSC
jgi:glycine/D-amino acid oxidase-like deaminating enzyme